MYPVTKPIPNPLIVGTTAAKGNPIIQNPKIKFTNQKLPETFIEFNTDLIIL